MRKIIQRTKICKHCQNQIKPAKFAWFCDNCKKLICDETKSPKDYGLQISVFFKQIPAGQPDTIHIDLCGYKCLRQWLVNYNPKKEVWFVVLPYIEAKETEKWTNVRDRFLREFMNDNPSIR
jgi:hypothetical protein